MTTAKRSATAVFLAAAAALAASACGSDGDEGSATMSPGENCIACHSEFTLAGTVYAADTMQGVGGVDVAVTDSSGTRHYFSNEVGNFFTSDALTFPVDVTVSRGGAPASMNNATGACNTCHDASNRITVP